MSEELQTAEDSGITLDSEAQTTEVNTESGAELATASPEEGKQNTEDSGVKDSDPEGFQKRMNKKHFEAKEAERKAQEAIKRAEEAEARLKEFQGSDAEKVVPPIPDSWDENYETRLKEREEAIRHNERIAYQKQVEADKQAVARKEQEAEALRIQQEKTLTFADNATKLGMSEADLVTAANTVANYGVSPEVADFLLTEEDGPLITAYLAANPVELDDIARMSSINAGIKLATDIRAKASNLKPAPSAAPDPATTLNGKGIPAQDRGPRGATFE